MDGVRLRTGTARPSPMPPTGWSGRPRGASSPATSARPRSSPGRGRRVATSRCRRASRHRVAADPGERLRTHHPADRPGGLLVPEVGGHAREARRQQAGNACAGHDVCRPTAPMPASKSRPISTIRGASTTMEACVADRCQHERGDRPRARAHDPAVRRAREAARSPRRKRSSGSASPRRTRATRAAIAGPCL